MLIHCQIGQKRFNVLFPHLGRMAFVMVHYKTFDPLHIRFFRLVGIMLEAQRVPYLIQ